jgi:peroxiredoxin
MPAIQAGKKAPDFELKGTDGKKVSLSELLGGGKYVVLAFYPAAWTSVCGSEMSLYQEMQDEFAKYDAIVVGISEDNSPSIKAWAEDRGLTLPMLSDFHPRGEAAEAYGVLRNDGLSERALFIVDPKGVLRYSYVSPIGENPGVDRLFDALEQIRKEDGL